MSAFTESDSIIGGTALLCDICQGLVDTIRNFRTQVPREAHRRLVKKVQEIDKGMLQCHPPRPDRADICGERAPNGPEPTHQILVTLEFTEVEELHTPRWIRRAATAYGRVDLGASTARRT